MFTLRKIPVSRIWFVLFLIDGTDLTKQFQSLAQYSPTYQIIFALSFKSQFKATFPLKSCTELSFRCRIIDESEVMCLFPYAHHFIIIRFCNRSCFSTCTYAIQQIPCFLSVRSRFIIRFGSHQYHISITQRVMEQEYQLCGCELLPFALC